MVEKVKEALSYEVVKADQKGIAVIVVAAGNATRMCGVNKQLLEISGKPVIVRTLEAFENCEAVGRIILVVKEADLYEMQILAEKYNLSKLCDVVKGGGHRQESVNNGLALLKKDEQTVLIHDGARPLVDNATICRVIEGLKTYKAVTCGVKVKDTIKQVSADAVVEKTLNRDSLMAVQTPQGVRVAEYLKAVEAIDVSAFTDDTSIMEAAGYKVLITDGDYKNIKITTREDLILANAFFSEE
jgi:2-C-methyl-D-erythritol 4-phosphate cytidylyltransferase